jgi:membrane fusion protein (multidrug efflux system)
MAFPPPQVTVVAVTPQDLPVEREYIGQTKGSREVEIRPRVGGIIEQRLYEEGTPVAAGAVLFQLDPKSYEAQLAAAEAVLARTQAQRNQAAREWNRLKPLAADKVISRKALDDAQSAAELAEADVKAAAAAVREARLQLDYTQVTAPIAGVAGLAEKVEGAVVKAAEDRLTTLTVTDPMDVYFSVSENELLLQQKETADGSLQKTAADTLQVKVRLADGSVPDRIGHINFRDARIDTQTGTLSMRARLPNADGLFKSGQFVRVIVTGAVRPDAITVPQKAVLEGPQGKFVYVIGKGKDGAPVAEIRPVDVGEWAGAGDARSWVIRKGLADGDQVIVDNLIKVQPGAPVQIADPATNNAAEQTQPHG